MSNHLYNQSAYPQSSESSTGMTKLEAFTMAALQGLCANSAYSESPHDDIAVGAVMIAKATLDKLQKEQL